jgi:mitochondrial fission protein ELM1
MLKNISDKDHIHVVVVVDGRPGHEKQSYGIIKALENRLTVSTTVVDISPRGLGYQFNSYLRLLLGFSFTTFTLPFKADIVIGTGTRTHTTVLSLKKHFHVPAITCMTPGKHLRNLFDICFVPEHDGLTGSNFFYTCGAPNSNINKKNHKEDKGLILIGGVDNKSHVWESKEIVENILHVIAKEQKINWTISSSPRTPQLTVDLLTNKIRDYHNCAFYDFKDTARGWVEQQYDTCKTVWVTSDSISMLYEALSSGCSVHIFPISWKKDSSKFKRNEDLLIAKGLVTPFSVWEEGRTQPFESPQLNEAQRCADYILQTCWTKN